MTVLLSTVSSDAHTWNLVYLQLLIEEHGHRVVNLGACVPDDHLIAQVRQIRPDLVVISTVNGHGRIDGERMIRALRAHPDLATVPVVIGGKLTVDGALTRQVCDDLLAAGFDDVFDADADVPRFRTLLRASTLPERVMVP
jgi:methylmalonyl-CoA mutase cobalamin-binding subunit